VAQVQQVKVTQAGRAQVVMLEVAVAVAVLEA
jgi:hypothetical protein